MFFILYQVFDPDADATNPGDRQQVSGCKFCIVQALFMLLVNDSVALCQISFGPVRIFAALQNKLSQGINLLPQPFLTTPERGKF